jgi:ubiquitin-protein ligase
MSIRVSRLRSEYERLQFLLEGHERIRIVGTSGRPPERYTIEYRVKGLVEEAGAVIERDSHRAEIILGMDYPKEMPRCVMVTPVFHPNIDHLAVCTEDIGAVGQTLDETVVFIGRMIAFQTYNLQSPRNGDAARWTKEHLDRLPLDDADLFCSRLIDSEAAVRIGTIAAAEVEPEPLVLRDCGNCGAVVAFPSQCAAGHAICADCQIACDNCETTLCLLCPTHRCRHCREVFCVDCVVECRHCRSWGCLAHLDHACPTLAPAS